MKPTILISGATGVTGSAATRQLLELGFPVRALVHGRDERSSQLENLGAEIFVGDILNFGDVRKAFDGIERAYFVYPLRPGIAQASAQFAEAALEAKAEFVVNMSQISARSESKSDSALQHWLSERVFDWAGTPVAHLRPTYFAEWLTRLGGVIRQGRLAVPLGTTGRHAWVTGEDQGRVIAGILADPASHQGQTYPLYGSAEVTLPETAAILSEVLGREIRYEHVTPEQFVRDSSGGLEVPFLTQHITEVSIDHNLGLFAGMNDLVERIGGRTPMTLVEFIETHRAELT